MQRWLKPIPEPRANVNRRRNGRMLTDEGKCALGELTNLSCTGVSISGRGKCPVKVDDTLPIEIACEDMTVAVTIRVAWIEKDRFRHYNLGAEFCDLDDATREKITQLSHLAGTRLALV